MITPDQDAIIGTVIQILNHIKQYKDLKSPEMYKIIQMEISSLEDTLSTEKLIDLRNYVQEIYLLIRNHEET